MLHERHATVSLIFTFIVTLFLCIAASLLTMTQLQTISHIATEHVHVVNNTEYLVIFEFRQHINTDACLFMYLTPIITSIVKLE